MQRTTRKIKYNGKTLNLCGLFPADFFECAYWPFSFYKLPEDNKVKSTEIKRDWKIKPESMIEEEEKLAASIRRAFKVGCNLQFDNEYENIKENENLHTYLLSEIYTLTYKLNTIEKYLSPVEIISREFAESIAIKSKAMNIEPFSLLFDLSHESPALYNPKRWDFNWLVLGCGWERERKEIEKAQREIQSRMNARKR
jgi:hypothetical protein